jgi:hypothetical protein
VALDPEQVKASRSARRARSRTVSSSSAVGASWMPDRKAIVGEALSLRYAFPHHKWLIVAPQVADRRTTSG